jgi:hypothetical protein
MKTTPLAHEQVLAQEHARAQRYARAAQAYARALEAAATQGDTYARACAQAGAWPGAGEGELRQRMRDRAELIRAALVNQDQHHA